MKLLPADTITASPGKNVDFTCYVTDRFDSIRWLINGTYLDHLELQKLKIHSELNMEGLKILRFSNLPLKYNHTTINCIGQGSYGRTIVSNQATLLVVEDKSRPTATELGILCVYMQWCMWLGEGFGPIIHREKSFMSSS